jgi:hypothetical protein
MIRHIIPKGDLSAEHKRLVRQQLDDLPDDKPWLIQAQVYRRKRTLEQNSFLHAVPMKIICDHTGHSLDDMKIYLMGRAFGEVEYEVMGEIKTRPRLGTSQLNTEQFAWFLDWLEAWASQELGLLIPKPGEIIEDTGHNNG